MGVLSSMLSPGGRREIRLQICVRSRGPLLHGLPRQPAPTAQDGHGAPRQRGGHGAPVPLRREHGLHARGGLLQPPPLQRRLRVLGTHGTVGRALSHGPLSGRC